MLGKGWVLFFEKGFLVMAILKVTDKSTDKVISIKIDPDDLKRLGKYTYVINENYNSKPFREVKIAGSIRKIFLARDVMKFKFGDGRVCGYKNGDIYDCRRENLIEGWTPVGQKDSGTYWPHTLKSLMNFLDKRKGEDEDVASTFLAKAQKVKYTRKRIDLILNENDYNEYKSKNINMVMMRVLHKHFEWGGQVVVAKDVTKTFQLEPQVLQLEPQVPQVLQLEPQAPHPQQIPQPEPEKSNVIDFSLFKQYAKQVPIEDLIGIVIERGATEKIGMSIQFNSKG